MDVRIPHPCNRDQDGNTLYNSSGEKDRYGSIPLRLIRRNTLAEDISSCPGSSTRSGSLGVYPHSPSVHVASLHIGNWCVRLCIPYSCTGWLVIVTSCITSAYIYMSHVREMMAEGTVGSADPGPRAIDVENTAPFGAPELPPGYVFSDWLR